MQCVNGSEAFSGFMRWTLLPSTTSLSLDALNSPVSNTPLPSYRARQQTLLAAVNKSSAHALGVDPTAHTPGM